MSFLDHAAVRPLLQPGMRLMGALNFRAKMALMAVVLLVPLSGLTVQSTLKSYRDLQSTQSEAAATPILGLILEVATQTQMHRGLVNRAMAGDATVGGTLQQTRAALAAATDALQSAMAEQPDAQLAALWNPIRQQLGRFASADVRPDPEESFRAHAEQVEALRHMMSRVAESSGLLLDPEAAPFHLMHLAVEPLLAWTEAVALIRGRGTALLQRGQASAAERAEIVARTGMLAMVTQSAEEIVAALGRSGEPAPAGFAAALSAARDYGKHAETTFAATTVAGGSGANFDAGSAVIAQAIGVSRVTLQRLQELLDERSRALMTTLVTTLALGAFTLLGSAYMTLVFFRTSFGAIRVLEDSVRRLAQGDFARAVRVRKTDELATVSRSLDDMTGRLSELVGDIRSNATVVAHAGLSLAEDTKALSERTEAQASVLEQTSASVQELSGAVRQNAKGAEDASTLAAHVRHIAEDGGKSIQSAVTSMQDILSSSRRVQEIVSVIEGLSFQTNLLALNAAVEAACAGEQGRGFAVVAAEVRLLAQRSAESAREIKSLIRASALHVDTGVTEIGNASSTLIEIVRGIRDVADSVHAIKTSTAEQSSGLEQIAQAVAHIDTITQQNAQMVESAFNSSAQLSRRAERLSAAVSTFRLRQGSADEALAMVRKAVVFYKSQGASALGRITDPANGFRDRDLYVFALDRRGVYRALAGKPEKVGTAVGNSQGVDGDKLVRDAFEQAAHGGGWIDYDFTNPQTGAVEPKTSYVEPVTADLVLGCGVYKVREDMRGANAVTASAPRMRKDTDTRLAPARTPLAA